MECKKPTTHPRPKIFLIFILVLTSYSIRAQDKNTAELLIGTWSLDYDRTISNIDFSSKQHYDTISQERKNRIIDSFSQRRMTFNSDGTYVLQVRIDRELNGSWELQNDGLTLTIVLDGTTVEQKVEDIDGSSIVLNLGGDQNTNRLFRKWYLNKVGS